MSGMNDYMAKPIDPDRVVQTLLRYAQPRPGRTDGVRGMAMTVDPADWPVVAGIQTEAVRGRLGGDMALFRRLLQGFAAEYTDTTSLKQAWALPVDASQGVTFGKRLHRLHGSASMLGMMDLATSVRALQQCMEAPDKAADASSQLLLAELAAQLVDRLDEVLGAIAALPPLPSADFAESQPKKMPGHLPDLRPLLASLRDKQFSALDEFDQVREALRAVLPPQDMASLEQAMSRLDFDVATRLLTDLPPQA